MIKFIRKITLFSILLIIIIIFLEFLVFPHNKNVYSDKFNLLKEKSTEIVITGNSHLGFGIIADSLSFDAINIANKGRELETDIDLLTYDVLSNKKKIKAILLPISYYSLFKNLSNNNKYYESQKRLYCNFYKIKKYSQGFFKDMLILHEPFRELLNDSFVLPFNNKSKFSRKGWRANNTNFVADVGENGIEKKLQNVEKALLDKKVLGKNLERLKNFSNLCKDLGITLYIIIPPYSEYYFGISKGKYNDLIIKILSKSNFFKEIKIIKSNDFMTTNTQYYENSDHLNKKGAIKYTKKIDSILKLN